MQKVRGKPHFDFNGAHLAFYQDIFRRTLMQRRALHTPSWKPFRMQACHTGGVSPFASKSPRTADRCLFAPRGTSDIS